MVQRALNWSPWYIVPSIPRLSIIFYTHNKAILHASIQLYMYKNYITRPVTDAIHIYIHICILRDAYQNWNFLLHHSEKLTPLCLMGANSEPLSKPIGILLSGCFEGFQGPLNWAPMIPRDASLSVGSPQHLQKIVVYTHRNLIKSNRNQILFTIFLD